MYIIKTSNKSKEFDMNANDMSNPFKTSIMRSFDVGIDESVSFPNMIDQCHVEITDIQKRLKEINESFHKLTDIHKEIDYAKKSIGDGIIKNEIFIMSDEIKKTNMMIRNISDSVHSYESHNKLFMEESRLTANKMQNEINGICNLSKMYCEDAKSIYKDMNDYNKQIGLAGINSANLMDKYNKKFAILNENLDTINDSLLNHTLQIKSQNQYRLTIIIAFAVICAILVALCISIIVIFK